MGDLDVVIGSKIGNPVVNLGMRNETNLKTDLKRVSELELDLGSSSGRIPFILSIIADDSLIEDNTESTLTGPEVVGQLQVEDDSVVRRFDSVKYHEFRSESAIHGA